VIRNDGGANVADFLNQEIAAIQPALVTNMVRNQKDKNAGSIIQLVSEKYLMIKPINLGGVVYDNQLNNLVSSMAPLAEIDPSNEAFVGMYDITTKLIS